MVLGKETIKTPPQKGHKKETCKEGVKEVPIGIKKKWGVYPSVPVDYKRKEEGE